VADIADQAGSWIDNALQALLQWTPLDNAQAWAQAYPDETLVGGSMFGLLLAVMIVAVRVGRHDHKKLHELVEPVFMPDRSFEERLGLSRDELAEVGLPLMTPAPAPAITPSSSVENVEPAMPDSLSGLSVEHLMVVARYCLWKGNPEGAREAIAPIMQKGSADERKAALALLEGR
jgi:hypothetical protein